MPTLIVKAVSPLGRYRAGLRFSREPSIVGVTEAQEAAIRADAALVVVESEPTVAAPVVAVAEDAPAVPAPAPKAKR